jgi:hypothetical protein
MVHLFLYKIISNVLCAPLYMYQKKITRELCFPDVAASVKLVYKNKYRRVSSCILKR